MCDTPIFATKDQTSSGCPNAQALRVAIDQPIPGMRVVRVAGELDMQTAPHCILACSVRSMDVADTSW